ncbi:hypothetical protein BROUX41_004049 [Berkeleyomyces rouxiae]|uniref:uncharacterized protein n=1 Tax=Berkeleyomyces rouxiae TaxID=2035830 RepID=UPI003B7D3724
MNQQSQTINNKRKATETGSDVTTTKRLQARPKASARLPKTQCQVQWPEPFKALERLHRALNMVFTFCSARKHMMTTFEMLKSAVEANLRRPITIDEVAQVVAIEPELFQFAYVDEATLQPLDLDPFQMRVTTEASNRDSWIRADAAGGDYPPTKQTVTSNEPSHVLYFEFIDNPKKKRVVHGEPENSSTSASVARPRRRPKEDGKPGAINHKQLMKLVSQRNELFTDAINAFIGKCISQDEDPMNTLRKESQRCVPKMPEPTTLIPKNEYQQSIPATIPTERRPFSDIIEELKASSWYSDQIMPNGHYMTPSKEAQYSDLEFLLSQTLVNAIYNALGVVEFYSHQAEALNALHSGHNVVVSTSTSSGKSLIYQLPVLYDLEKDRQIRAFYIFPTKALAQDQRQSLARTLSFMVGFENTMVETFDGDTAGHVRDGIRDNANIIFTNPDMLHLSILPQHQSWSHALKTLRYVVVDELHYYDGQMGAHMAFIMRRLRRLCAYHGNTNIRFISCSATVANPLEHFERIFGLSNATLVSKDGSPSALRHHLLWNTVSPALAGAAADDPCHALHEMAWLFCALLLRGVRVLAFCKMRSQCEHLLGAIKDELTSLGRVECAALVMGYRGGYTVQDRRRIEVDMFAGRLRGLVATSALELGVDMGTLDCVLSWGFPRSLASLRQQFGRAGRRAGSGKDALAVLVGDRTTEDQYYMENAAELQMPVTAELWSDLKNREILEGHLNCAAFEEPVDRAGDQTYFGSDLPDVLVCPGATARVPPLAEDNLSPGKFRPRRIFWPYPAKKVSIRAIEDDTVSVVDLTNGRFVVLEEMELSRATFSLFAGAVYLHQGQAYTVKEYRAKERIAKVELVKTAQAAAYGHWTGD